MDQLPKFVLSFDSKHPGCPFLIREYAIVNGAVASRPHSSYPKLKEAFSALCELSGEEIILAASVTGVDNIFSVGN